MFAGKEHVVVHIHHHIILRIIRRDVSELRFEREGIEDWEIGFLRAVEFRGVDHGEIMLFRQIEVKPVGDLSYPGLALFKITSKDSYSVEAVFKVLEYGTY